MTDDDLDEIHKQMRSLRKKLRKLKKETIEEVKEPPAAIVVNTAQDLENDKENGKCTNILAKSPSDEPSREEGEIA